MATAHQIRIIINSKNKDELPARYNNANGSFYDAMRKVTPKSPPIMHEILTTCRETTVNTLRNVTTIMGTKLITQETPAQGALSLNYLKNLIFGVSLENPKEPFVKNLDKLISKYLIDEIEEKYWRIEDGWLYMDGFFFDCPTLSTILFIDHYFSESLEPALRSSDTLRYLAKAFLKNNAAKGEGDHFYMATYLDVYLRYAEEYGTMVNLYENSHCNGAASFMEHLFKHDIDFLMRLLTFIEDNKKSLDKLDYNLSNILEPNVYKAITGMSLINNFEDLLLSPLTKTLEKRGKDV